MEKIREYLGARTTDPKKVVEGKFLFTLYDTHGFPVDLAQEVFQDAGWSVPPESLAAFESEMEAQRGRARAGGTVQAARGEDGPVAIYQQLSAELPRPTFLGYGALTAPARVLAMVDGSRRRPEAGAGETVEIILDRTPAYAESGGQIGDTGALVGREGE